MNLPVKDAFLNAPNVVDRGPNVRYILAIF